MEQRIGVVSHYFNKIHVAGVILESDLTVGDTIHIKGHTTDFIEKVESIEVEHESIEKAKKGDDVGLKVREHAREHDVVYKIVEQ
jgi:putative protease